MEKGEIKQGNKDKYRRKKMEDDEMLMEETVAKTGNTNKYKRKPNFEEGELGDDYD